MNLFSRLSEILDGDDQPNCPLRPVSRWRAEYLVASMEKQEARVRQSAVTLIAAERAVTRELDMVRRNNQADPLLLERLLEEHGRALTIKVWLKQTLRDLRTGLRQARSFRATVRRWECVAAVRQAIACRRQFWRACAQLADLADEQLDGLEQQNAPIQSAHTLPKQVGEVDNA